MRPSVHIARARAICRKPQIGPHNFTGDKQDRQCTCKSIIEARSRNHCCRGKAVSITYFSVCDRARASVRVGARACVYVRWRSLPYLSSMQRACAILLFVSAVVVL